MVRRNDEGCSATQYPDFYDAVTIETEEKGRKSSAD